MPKLAALLAVILLMFACSDTPLEHDSGYLPAFANSEGSGCPPDCVTRPPTPEEFNDMINAVNKMDGCPNIQGELTHHLNGKFGIITDPVYRDSLGGAFTATAGVTGMYLHISIWEVYSGPMFESKIFEYLKHEGAHAADYRTRPEGWGGTSADPWEDEDYHGSAWGNFFDDGSSCQPN